MYTVGQLVSKFSLSRSTLLYYDKIGLLKPSSRSDANYRLYSQQDYNRMLQISTYKEAGLSLGSIADILISSTSQSCELLEQRLEKLNLEMSRIRKQQLLIVELLGKDSLLRECKVMNKQQWVKILTASGMDENAMRQWHIEFERDLPEAHSDFLESLGIEANEISKIRDWSKKGTQ